MVKNEGAVSFSGILESDHIIYRNVVFVARVCVYIYIMCTCTCMCASYIAHVHDNLIAVLIVLQS